MLEKTCCALAWAAKRLRHYLMNHTTWLISRMDPIKYIFEKPTVTGKIARWQMLLSEYDIVFKAQKAVRGSVIADHLAYQPLDEYQPIKFDFPDEEVVLFNKNNCTVINTDDQSVIFKGKIKNNVYKINFSELTD